ncbi:MAG TPA: patatin-like phospholipase family protein [Patescibacteria group bacterium]|nr:patatin-like phospholipase family protein [Patescibacteria group bacterium]
MAGLRGLVLGGGGITGIAWELGIIAGLAERGVDLTAADVVVGTSAGSAVGAQVLSGAPLEDLYAGQLADASGESASRLGFTALARFLLAAAWPGDPRRARARIGRAALRARTLAEADFRAVFEAMLKSREWPDRQLRITAVDALSGEDRVFARDSNVELVDAVAASCAVPLVFPPITVDGRRYIDGGTRSIANADLATGCDRVVVVAPIEFGIRRSQRISHQLSSLGAGVSSMVVTADSAARKALGTNPLDPARRAASAQAGRDQADRVLDSVRAVWGSG